MLKPIFQEVNGTMAMLPSLANRSWAAWQPTPGELLQIGVVDLPPVVANEILMRNAAIDINPLDWILQDTALLPWLNYPAILGSDVTGEVAAVASEVERCKFGNRVFGQAIDTTFN